MELRDRAKWWAMNGMMWVSTTFNPGIVGFRDPAVQYGLSSLDGEVVEELVEYAIGSERMSAYGEVTECIREDGCVLEFVVRVVGEEMSLENMGIMGFMDAPRREGTEGVCQDKMMRD